MDVTKQARPLTALLMDFLGEIKPFKGFNTLADVLVGARGSVIVPNDRDHRIATEFVIFPTDLDIHSTWSFTALPFNELDCQFHLIIVKLRVFSGCQAFSDELASHCPSPPLTNDFPFYLLREPS